MKAAPAAGRISDHGGSARRADADLPATRALIAGKGCDPDAIREAAEAGGGAGVVPAPRNREEQPPIDGSIHALRTRIERGIKRLKNARRLATRYDRTAAGRLGFIEIASLRLWFRHSST